MLIQQIPIKFIRNLVIKWRDPARPEDELAVILMDWHKKTQSINNNSSIPTFFGKMKEYIDDGQITVKQVKYLPNTQLFCTYQACILVLCSIFLFMLHEYENTVL